MLFFTIFTVYKAKRHNTNLNDKGMEQLVTTKQTEQLRSVLLSFEVDFENVETKPVQSGIKRRFHNFNDWIEHVFNNVKQSKF